jgi:hypothetical protein
MLRRHALPLLGCLVLFGGETLFAQEQPADPPAHAIPAEVLEALGQLKANDAGNWWSYRLGGVNGAFTVNWGANGRCLLVDGRRFADAMAFTAVAGWFQPAERVVGLVLFENGDSLLLRATIAITGENRRAMVDGDVSGTLFGQPVKARFAAERREDQWTIQTWTDGRDGIKGVFSSPTRGRRNTQ